MEAIKKIDLSKLTPLELETVSNYVLYGKDSNGTSSVDRKEIQIDTKFDSYNKQHTTSLDELIESPTFNEATLTKNPTRYKKTHFKIDRDNPKIQKIEGMQELWQQIDNVANNLKELKKIELPNPQLRREIYLKEHLLIQLRTQQYYLLDSQTQTITTSPNKSQYHSHPTDSQTNYPILPRGVMRTENDLGFIYPRLEKDIEDNREIKIYTEEDREKLEKENKFYIDFANPQHIYQLILFYQEIQDSIKFMPDSLLNNLLWTLDFYIDKAHLSDQQRLIVRDKKNRLQNREITQHLKEELGIYHQENYVSTIWNKIIKQITEAVELNYDEYLCKNYDRCWKKCNRCGEELFRDTRNFVRKHKASDGLTNRCKQCDKRIRELNKGKYSRRVRVEKNNKIEVEENKRVEENNVIGVESCGEVR